MKKRRVITAISAVIGAAALFVSAIATYATSNGYVLAKNAVKNSLNEDNLTWEISFSAKIDDKILESNTEFEKFDREGLVKYSYRNSKYERYYQDGMYISIDDRNNNGIIDFGDGASVDDSLEEGDLSSIWLFSISDREEKFIRFAELLFDAIIGDLKNNIILTDSDDEGDTYSLNLAAYQIPELYQAGLDLMFAESSSYYIENASDMDEAVFYEYAEDNPSLLLSGDVGIGGVNIDVKIDKKGRLAAFNAEASIVGKDKFLNTHTFTTSINASVYDYGSTVCDRADLSIFADADEDALYIYRSYYYANVDVLEKRLERLQKSYEEAYGAYEKEIIMAQIESSKREYKYASNLVQSENYIRNNEIRNALLFDDLDDAQRRALIDEKAAITKSLKYNERAFWENTEIVDTVETGAVIIDADEIEEDAE